MSSCTLAECRTLTNATALQLALNIKFQGQALCKLLMYIINI